MNVDLKMDWSREDFLTWPNFFTLLRLLCAPVFVWLLFARQDRQSAAILLALLGSTDWVDGWLARRLNQVSDFGAMFDPTVDRVLFFVAVPCLIWDGSVPIWLAICALVREFVVAALATANFALSGSRLVVTMEGKTGTFALMFAFPLFLAAKAEISYSSLFEWLAWFCATPGLVYSWYSALGQYGFQLFQKIRRRGKPTL